MKKGVGMWIKKRSLTCLINWFLVSLKKKLRMERFRFDEPEELDEVPFRFRIYHKSELSQLYFPQCSSKTALQNLGRWIKRCTELEDALLAIGYDKHRKYYLRPEVELIVKFLGEP